MSFNLCSNCSIVTPSAPAAPPFLFTFNHASHTRCLGMSCVLPCNFGSLMRFHPFRLITFVHQDDPAPSLPSPLRYAGGSQLLRASPPARPASVLSPSRIPPLGVLPLACPPHSLPLGTDTPVSGRAFTCSRREPGPGSRLEHVKARPDTGVSVPKGNEWGGHARGRTPSGGIREGLSTDAGRAGGLARSSCDPPAYRSGLGSEGAGSSW